MSRKPFVVTNAVRAPLPVRIVFVATVEPWTSSSGVRPASSMPARIASDGSSGVLGRLCVRTSPPSHSTRSVNVPPESTPSTREAIVA